MAVAGGSVSILNSAGEEMPTLPMLSFAAAHTHERAVIVDGLGEIYELYDGGHEDRVVADMYSLYVPVLQPLPESVQLTTAVALVFCQLAGAPATLTDGGVESEQLKAVLQSGSPQSTVQSLSLSVPSMQFQLRASV